MTHPPATCELCGGTGLYSPSALPCPKGCKEFDIVEQANDVLQALSDWAVIYGAEMCDDEVVKQSKSRVLRYGALAYIADATDKLRNVITALSEADQREKDARSKLQAMHRRAQASERVEQMIIDTLSGWYRLYLEGSLKNRSRRGLFYTVMKELKIKAEKVRSARNALKDEVR